LNRSLAAEVLKMEFRETEIVYDLEEFRVPRPLDHEVSTLSVLYYPVSHDRQILAPRPFAQG
jgi:hypothetical protein